MFELLQHGISILVVTFTIFSHVTLIPDGQYLITWLKEHRDSDPQLYQYSINKTKTHISVRNTTKLDFLDGRILQAEVMPPPRVATGKLNNGNFYLMLRVPDARITDAGNYSCFAQFMDQGSVVNISGQVNPQTIDVIDEMAARLMSKCWVHAITGLSLFYFATVVSQSRDDVILGSTFTIFCHVTLIPDGYYLITWLKEHRGSDPQLYQYPITKTKTHISVINTTKLDFLDGRIFQAEVEPPHVATGKLNVGNFYLILRVPDARITDAGNYSCFAQFMDQGPVVNISGQVNPQTIDVIGPPTAPTLTSLQYPNGTVAVTCNSTHGHPPPQIQWYQLEEGFTPDRDMVSRGTACLQEMDAYCLVPSVSETITVAGNISAFYRCETIHSTGSLSSPSLILLGLFDIGDVDLTPGHSSLWKYAGVGVGAALIIASLVVMANFDRVSKRCRKKAENTESDRQPKGQYIDKRRSTESTDVYDIENETQLA